MLPESSRKIKGVFGICSMEGQEVFLWFTQNPNKEVPMNFLKLMYKTYREMFGTKKWEFVLHYATLLLSWIGGVVLLLTVGWEIAFSVMMALVMIGFTPIMFRLYRAGYALGMLAICGLWAYSPHYSIGAFAATFVVYLMVITISFLKGMRDDAFKPISPDAIAQEG